MKTKLRQGITLSELLVAIAVMGLVAVALGALAKAVEQSTGYTRGHETALQYARVAIQRIGRHIEGAHANDQFPGFIVINRPEQGWDFPDMLAVWYPEGAPQAIDSLPLFSELIIYAPDPTQPNRLLEITARTDHRVVPPITSLGAWRSELQSIISSSTARRVVLLENLRTGQVAASGQPRGNVRFLQRLRPSQSDYGQFQAGTKSWEDLAWAQGIRGTQRGMRQAWCRIELQLIVDGGANGGMSVVPYFGSAALYYQLKR